MRAAHKQRATYYSARKMFCSAVESSLSLSWALPPSTPWAALLHFEYLRGRPRPRKHTCSVRQHCIPVPYRCAQLRL